MKNHFFIKSITIYLFCSLFIAPLSFAEDKKTIAILPFEMIANQDISYLQEGILQMLHSRLNWDGRVSVIKQRNMEDLLKTMDHNAIDMVKEVSEKIHTDYIMTGSVTQFSNAFSIDTKIFNVKTSQTLFFFDQSTKIDDIIPKLDIVAAKINNKLFNRKTATYNKLIKDQLNEVEKWKRQNPERMMPQVPQVEQQKKTQWWKFWEFL